MRVFLVEDHIDIAENIAEFLEAEGHEVSVVMDGASAFALLRVGAAAFEVLVVDVMLPRLDGLSLVRELRAAGVDRPVLFLTARDGIEDKIAGFRSGGDDYLVKPFHMEELLLRLEALARRVQPPSGEPAGGGLAIGDLLIDPEQHRVRRAGQTIRLNPTCFTLLLTLAKASPRPLSHEELEQVLWQGAAPESGALRSSIYLLRKAIDRPFPTPLLQTVHGVGYRLSVDDG
jgi:DNA-binding response OmpR family regulator